MADQIRAMLDNHDADSWGDVVQDTAAYDDETKDPLTRVRAYVDHCFDAYSVVSNNLDCDQIQVCIADLDRRRGEARKQTEMDKSVFGKRVVDSKHRLHHPFNHCVFIAKELVGVPPEEDNGAGWKACVRHELGHCIDYEKRGVSGHGSKFKAIMAGFGENNDGMSTHGWAPRVHRD
jgi:hypothetical protein